MPVAAHAREQRVHVTFPFLGEGGDLKGAIWVYMGLGNLLGSLLTPSCYIQNNSISVDIRNIHLCLCKSLTMHVIITNWS